MSVKRFFGTAVLLALLVFLGLIINSRYFKFEEANSQSASTPMIEEIPSPTPSETPELTPSPTPTPTPEPYADKPDIDISSWEYTLVNPQNLLSSDFKPELSDIGNGQYFDSRAADALKDFVSAAKAEGLSVYITSSYRSYATQEYLFNNKVNQYLYSEGSQEAATEKAKTIVAYPGTSEHQLGLACDIVDKYYDAMNESLENTALSQWMAAHCAEYGFILRYPKDKTDITGVMFEPWHFRYVGTTAAEYIMGNGLAFEEFVALYK